MRGIRSIGITLLFCFLALPVHAADVVRIYKVQHRTAEELLPLVQTAMAREGSVEADGGSNTLVLAGSSEAVAAALLLLSKVDRPERSVVLRYQSRRLRELEGQGIHVDWSGAVGPVRVGSLGFPGDGSGVGIHAAGNAGARESDLAGEVRILEGRSASIMTGQSVPVTTRRRPSRSIRPHSHPVDDVRLGGIGLRGATEDPRRWPHPGGAAAHRCSPSRRCPRGLFDVRHNGCAGAGEDCGPWWSLTGCGCAELSLAAGTGSSQREDETLLLLTATVE